MPSATYDAGHSMGMRFTIFGQTRTPIRFALLIENSWNHEKRVQRWRAYREDDARAYFWTVRVTAVSAVTRNSRHVTISYWG